jgi:Holliday junction resolvasome RuvABC ATP-dependent DNA helicase subunit
MPLGPRRVERRAASSRVATRRADEPDIRTRLKRVVDLTQARLRAVVDPKVAAAKLVRLSEIQASLAANKDPKTLAIISQSFLEIEARLARLLNN